MPEGAGTSPFGVLVPGGQTVGVEYACRCFYPPHTSFLLSLLPQRWGTEEEGVGDGGGAPAPCSMAQCRLPPCTQHLAQSVPPPALSSCPHPSRNSRQARTGARSPVPGWGRTLPLTQAEELPRCESPVLQHMAAPERPCNELCLVSAQATSCYPGVGGSGGCWWGKVADAPWLFPQWPWTRRCAWSGRR